MKSIYLNLFLTITLTILASCVPQEQEVESLPETTQVSSDELRRGFTTRCIGSIEGSRSCIVDNGVGVQKRSCINNFWSSWSSCSAVSCSSGYVLSGGTCQRIITNTVPKISPINSIELEEKKTASISLKAVDAESNKLQFSFQSPLPVFAKFVEITNGEGRLDLAPLVGHAGNYLITVKVSDGLLVAEQSFNIKVTLAPAAVSVSKLALINTSNNTEILSLTNNAVIDLATTGKNLNVNVITNPSVVGSVKFELSGKEIENRTEINPPYALKGDTGSSFNSWTPQLGNYNLKVTPTSADGVVGVILSVNFQVVDTTPLLNLPPVINPISDIHLNLPKNNTIISAVASDADGSIASYLWVKKSGGTATLTNTSSATLSISALVAGNYEFEVTVTDNKGASAKRVAKVIVNAAPSLANISNLSLKVGETQNINVSATDAEGDNITLYFAQSLPSFMFFTDNQNGTGKIEIKPQSASDQGVHNLELMAADSKNAESKKAFSVTVNPAGSTAQQPEVYFAKDFNGASVRMTSGLGYLDGWGTSSASSGIYAAGIINSHFFNNSVSDHRLKTYAYQEIQDCNGKPCLYARSIEKDPNVSSTSRAQMSLSMKSDVNLPVYHTSHRMKLGPDLAALEQFNEKITWFVLFEVWNKRDSNMDGDQAGSARWDFSIFKDQGTNQKLYWALHGEYMQPANMQFRKFFGQSTSTPYYNKNVPIPLNKWFTLDFYLKRGQGSNGRITIKITVDGEQTQTLFDQAGTTIYPDRPDLYIGAWQPYKLYLSPTILTWMKNNNKKLEVYYENFIWYKN